MIGLTLVCIGIAMLISPIQSLLTIFSGLFIAEIPGKQNLEQRLISVPAVYKAINWIPYKIKGSRNYFGHNPGIAEHFEYS